MKKQKTDSNGLDLLVLAHSSELSGGGETSLLEMLIYLNSEGISVHVICPYEGAFSRALQNLEIPITIIPQPWWVLGKNDKADFRFTNAAIGQNVTRQVVDVINNLYPAVCLTNTIAIPWLAYAAAICNKPHVWMIHEAGFDFRYSIGREETIRTIDGLSEKIFFNSLYTEKLFLPLLSRNKSPGVMHPLSKLKTPNRSTPSPFNGTKNRFIMVGSVIRRKRAIDSITAIKTLKDRGIKAELAIVGVEVDEEYSEQLRDYCEKHDITKQIHFLGAKDNPTSYIQHADIGLMPSEAETFGLATVEIMAQGKPVIGAKDGGTPEIIQDGKNGLLYDLHDTDQLAEKMEYLINDPDIAEKLGEFAKKDVLGRFSPKQNYRPLIEYLENEVTVDKSINLTPLYSIVQDYKLLEQERISVTNQRDDLAKIIKDSGISVPMKLSDLVRRTVNLPKRGVSFSKRAVRKVIKKLGS